MSESQDDEILDSYIRPTNDVELLAAWEEQMRLEIPDDCKDYHQSSRFERPLIARLLFRDRKKTMNLIEDMLIQQSEKI